MEIKEVINYGQNPTFILIFMLVMFIIVLYMFISMHGDEKKNVLCSARCFDKDKLSRCKICPMDNKK